jgi:hypothetical protein
MYKRRFVAELSVSILSEEKQTLLGKTDILL